MVSILLCYGNNRAGVGLVLRLGLGLTLGLGLMLGLWLG